MFKRFLPLVIFLAAANFLFAQMPGMGGMGGGKGGAKAKIGHFYGKVVDSITGKSVPFAAIQISGPQWDTVTKTLKTAVLEGQLTGDNGEFSFDKLPIMGQFTIQISAMGYKPYSVTATFDMSKLMKGGQKLQNQAQSSGDMPNMSSVESLVNAIDKDLGNIRISPDATALKAVTVNGEAPPMELKLDKRVFDVSKSLTTTGGTAEDVLKTIPAVNVDIDGNVTLRNASPTIYVDGLPSTLTIDQIPSSSIDKIEVITNPSAKFDASAGSGGIINIILKHDQALGYNGFVRAGGDQYGKGNVGFDFNIRQGKVNFFLDLHYHQVKRIMYGQETRDTVAGQPGPFLTNTQKDTTTMNGYFAFARAGFDFFINNRNTITVSGTYGTGNFSMTDLLHTNTDTVRDILSNEPVSNTYENSVTNRVFNNYGASVSFKHLYPKEDENITASVTANEGSSTGNGTYLISNYNNDFNLLYPSIDETQNSGGTNYYYVGKLDFSDPLTKKIKLEAGLMATVNDVTSNNTIQFDGETDMGESTNYTFNQQVYAAYFTFSQDLTSRLSYQLALRVEQSLYSGQEVDTATTKLNPQTLLKPFPGAFITYHLTDKSDLQLSYTTHITRPSFMQLVVNNYSNPLSIQIANPNLLPAYQNSFELNFMHTFDKRSSLLLSAYYKITYDLITSQSSPSIYDSTLKAEQYINTYNNANYGYSEGAEATLQISPTQWLDVTANYNLYESGINATNLGVLDTAKPYLSSFAKLNLTFKLPKNFTLQFNGSYQSKAQIPAGGSGSGRWGGGGGGGGYGGITPSSTGYVIPTYSMDAAIKKEFLKNNKASITFNVRDVFATAVSGTYVTATDEAGVPLYYQTTSRHNLAPYFSLNLSYRFGQMDISLFKHKNNNIDMPPDTGGDTGGGSN